ncbi:3-dehydroquinate synthase [Bacillus thuringiensis]|uniref:3-dehydroquinate synthase n=1 Tax=Bacillus thuringiensis TaxID=1428 RepID=UPI000BFCBA5A|nr:3-dehydroquinate synthase [Bacillus thuringiensis]PGO54960.1 3-dehydroquinate synthase [Bacillus thuringiensis]
MATRNLLICTEQKNYPIFLGEGIAQNIGSVLQKKNIAIKKKFLIVTDNNVAKLYLDDIKKGLALNGYKDQSYIILENGENTKTLDSYEKIINKCIEFGMNRDSYLIALGGGVIGDLTGFVAATYMRGIKFIQVPTTLLAHDSSVGGKVGINSLNIKNLLGAFYHPEMIIYDITFLKTLPLREIYGGFAEIIIHSILTDYKFFEWLEQNKNELLQLRTEPLLYAIQRSIEVKRNIVEKDTLENNIRALLNLGHTFGHAIESITKYSVYNHGEAVAIGTVISSLLSEKLGFAENLHLKIKSIFKEFKLPTVLPSYIDLDDMINIMKKDKKVKNSNLRFVLPKNIGNVEIVELNNTYIPLIKEAMREVQIEY